MSAESPGIVSLGGDAQGKWVAVRHEPGSWNPFASGCWYVAYCRSHGPGTAPWCTRANLGREKMLRAQPRGGYQDSFGSFDWCSQPNMMDLFYEKEWRDISGDPRGWAPPEPHPRRTVGGVTKQWDGKKWMVP